MNMTPMIDIVFLLIIFFMTVSQITQTLDEPVNLADVGPDGRPLETVSITINLDRNGRIIVAGQSWDMNELTTAIRREQLRVDERGQQLKVLIRCDRDCPGRSLNELNQTLARLGISRVRLSVQGHDRK
jgi:biopolymer transport protein ExbD